MSAPGRRLDHGSLLKVVSWNINSTAVGRATRAASAMDHLEEVFGDPSSPLVAAILEHPWIRKNFALSNAQAPWRYFTIIMVSQHVQTDRWFHIPFPNRTDRGVLAVDIPISSPDRESEQPKRILRLCTTHLDPLRDAEGEEPRSRQLAQVSALLKAPPTSSSEIIAGLVGGD
jgi:tyrosyl-DNA phosphodiesterase 2